MADVNGGDIENRFAAAHDHARAPADVTVRAIGREDVFQNAITSAAGERPQKHKFDKFGRNAQRAKEGRKQLRQKIGDAAHAKQGRCNQNGGDEREDVHHQFDCAFCTFHKSVIGVDALDDAIDKQNDEDDWQNVGVHSLHLLFSLLYEFVDCVHKQNSHDSGDERHNQRWQNDVRRVRRAGRRAQADDSCWKKLN